MDPTIVAGIKSYPLESRMIDELMIRVKTSMYSRRRLAPLIEIDGTRIVEVRNRGAR